MRFRYLLLIFVVVFGATLAVIVGETLSAEAMAVTVGVVAGIGASIPTSLLVLWFAMRTAELRAVPAAPAAYPMEPPEPRIVVVHQAAPRPAPPALPAGYGGYAEQDGYGYAPAPEVLPAPRPARAQRRFIVADGYAPSAPNGFVMGEPQYEAVPWER